MTIIPKKLGAPKHPSEIQVSPEIMAVSVSETEQVYHKLETSNQGLSETEAARRLAEHGPNVVAQDRRHNRWRLFGRALINPLVILLSILATVSALTGDLRATVVMAVMVVLGVVLRFVQEARAETAAAKLKAMISVNATVVRDGTPREIPLAKLVPGDLVHLSAGDMIPADVRLISCKDFFVIQSSLTGESFPVFRYCYLACVSLGATQARNASIQFALTI
jgi:P-type Mg2+ transporter